MFKSATDPAVFTLGIIVFVIALILFGWLATRGKSEGENFLTGGRGIPIFLLLGTMAATCIGAGSSIGATATGYAHGWAGSLVGLGNGIGMFAMLVFCHTWKHHFADLPEEIQYYYGGNKNIRIVLGFLFTIAELVWVANSINGGSKFLTYITGMSEISCKLMISLGFMGYAIFGGYLSVVVTDTVQMVIILLGFFGIITKAVPLAGGLDSIRATYESVGNGGALSFLGFQSYGTKEAVTLLLSSFYNVFASNVIHQRLYTSSSVKNAKQVYLISGTVVVLFGLAPSILGMSAFTIAANNGTVLQEADHAFIYLATVALQPALGLFFLIAGLSAILSSADSNLMSCLLCVFNDVIPSITGKSVSEEKYKFWVRIAICLGVAAAFVTSIFATDVITFLLTVAGSLIPGLGVTLVLGRFWKRATWQGGIASAVGGALFGCMNLLIPAFRQMLTAQFGGAVIPVTIVSLILGISFSLCTKREEVSEEEVLARVRAFKN